MRVVVVLVALVVVLVGSVGAQEATSIGSPVASPVASDIGKTVRYANFDVTLVSAEFAESVRAEKAHGKYVVVWLEITNRTLGPIDFPVLIDDDVRLNDSAKRTFSVDFDASFATILDHEDAGMIDNFQPDVSYLYALVFDVALDATGFALSLSPETTFNLGI